MTNLEELLPVPVFVSLVDMEVELCLRLVRSRRFVELRLDRLTLSTDDLALALSQKAHQVIVSVRNHQHRSASGRSMIQTALHYEVDYLDAEFSDLEEILNLFPVLKNTSATKLICSYHDLEKMPVIDELREIITSSIKLGAKLVKLSPFIQTPQEAESLLSLLAQYHDLLIVPLGPLGLSTRTHAAWLGSKFIYAAVDEAHRAAPSQPTEMEIMNYIQNLNILQSNTTS